MRQSMRNPLVIDKPVINEVRYFNLFYCGRNILNGIDATSKWVCMPTSIYRYYTEMFKTLTDYNDRNNTPLLNKKIQEAIRKVM